MYKRLHHLALGTLLLGSAAISSGVGEYDRTSPVPMRAAMITQCRLGSAPLTEGSTPTAIAGVTVVSPEQAKCLIDTYSRSLLVVAAMDDMTQLPGAYPVPVLRYDEEGEAFQKRIASEFTPLTRGNKERPILIYCHHASCQYSANGSEHLARMGYTRIFWLRDGLKGWQAAGYALSATPRVPLGTTQALTEFSKGMHLSYNCFGEENHTACDGMVSHLYASYNAPDLKPNERSIVLGELLNTVAVHGALWRTGGQYLAAQHTDLNKSRGLLEEGMKVMRQAYADGKHPEAITDNLKLQQQMALTYLELDRPADAAAALRDGRVLVDRSYAGMASAPRNAQSLKTMRTMMISAERLEHEIAEFAYKRAGAGKTAEEARYMAIEQLAFARSEQWTGRLKVLRGEYEKLGLNYDEM